MGVSGAGKSTLGSLLADHLGCAMLEGDSLHSVQNVRRMSAGIALTDHDREDWLAAIAGRLTDAAHAGRGLVVTCSALKRSYRDVLRRAAPQLRLVYLKGGRGLLEERLRARLGHFMPATLLDSQLADLQEPGADEQPITCDISESPAALVEQIVQAL
jgi:gluconokinase